MTEFKFKEPILKDETNWWFEILSGEFKNMVIRYNKIVLNTNGQMSYDYSIIPNKFFNDEFVATDEIQNRLNSIIHEIFTQIVVNNMRDDKFLIAECVVEKS